MKSIGSRILQARKARKLRQADIANHLSITPGAVSAWEKGSNEPSIQNLSEVAIYLEVSFDWLATGRGEMDYQEAQGKEGEEGKHYIYISDDDRKFIENFWKTPQKWQESISEMVNSYVFSENIKTRHLNVMSKMSKVKGRKTKPSTGLWEFLDKVRKAGDGRAASVSIKVGQLKKEDLVVEFTKDDLRVINEELKDHEESRDLDTSIHTRPSSR